jgi:molybdopterin synthase sulfur carrier subunit
VELFVGGIARHSRGDLVSTPHAAEQKKQTDFYGAGPCNLVGTALCETSFDQSIDVTQRRTRLLALIAFTPHLRAVAPAGVSDCPGATLAEVLNALSPDYPRLNDYVRDDQGRLRKHIAIFIDGAMVARETALAQPLGATTDVFVFQALSGG